MKGVIFSELVDWVESDFSPEEADAMIRRSSVSSNGAYTSVGYYPYVEALELLIALSGMTARPVGELARTFGQRLSKKLAARYPQFMEDYSGVEPFLYSVENKVHMEVRKLYPNAKPPSIITTRTGSDLMVTYKSHRPFADVAHGLIEGFIDYFGEDMTVERLNGNEDGTQAQFLVKARSSS